MAQITVGPNTVVRWTSHRDVFKYVGYSLTRIQQLPYENERVFFIMRSRSHYYWLAEVSEDAAVEVSQERFRIARMDHLVGEYVRRTGMKFGGIMHTHPDPMRPEPSKLDLENSGRLVSYFPGTITGVYCPGISTLSWYDTEGVVWRRVLARQTFNRKKRQYVCDR